MIKTRFQVHLEASGKLYRWLVDHESNLKMVAGEQGIPLSHVIRENDAPDQTDRDTWEEKAALKAPLTGRLYKQDTIMVHNIILRNIADTSDAFT